jgi:hypothetical protein
MVLLATNDPITSGILKAWSVCRWSGIVGEADENGEDHYLWTYKKLEIGFNGNRIVDVNLTSEGKVKLVPNTRIAMSYSVSTEYYSFLWDWQW